MKKIIFLLLCTVSIYGQTYQNPTYGTLTLKTNVETTTATKIPAQETSGLINWLQPINIPITIVPTNYTPTAPTLGGHLDGINTKLGTIGTTTAGISTRVWFTADQTTITAGTFDLTNPLNKGTAPSHQQTVANDDGQKKYFTTDLIGNPFAMITTFPQGTYAGNLSVSTTPTNANQKFTVELYRCNNAGTPIASGVTGAVTGSLGVTVIMIMDSGEVTLANASVTNLPVSTILGVGGFTINAGERIRYHVSAEKVGTAGAVINESVYYGSSYNSFIDVPVIYNSSSIKDVSTVTSGVGTVTDALNTLNTGKIGGSGTLNFVSKWTSSGTQGDSSMFDDGSNVGIGTVTPYNDAGYRSFTVNGTNGGIFAMQVNGTLGGYLSSNVSQTSLIESRNLSIGFFTNNIQRANILSNGNIGLGTTDAITSPNNVSLGFPNGSIIQGRIGFPQLSLSSNINGDYYSAVYRTNNPAVQLVLDGLGGGVSFYRAVSGIANNPVTWLSSFGISSTGVVQINNLAGTGDGAVVASSTGDLKRVPIAITITTSTSITTATTDSNGVGQDGHHVIISNGVNAINLTCNGGVTTSYGKVGTGAITFVQGSGRTLVQLSGTAILSGIAGSTATLWSNGTTDYLTITNY